MRNRIILFHFAVLSLLFTWASPGFGQASGEGFLKTLDKAAYMEANLVYGQGGGRDLKLNLYHPVEGEGPFPAVVFVHGGGWRAGHPGHFSRQAMYLAAQGYVCACIEYRLSGEAQFPAAIEDCKCAVRWMRSEGVKHFHADPERIAISGGSAGGHLSLLAGTSNGVKELEGAGGHNEYSSHVQLVIAFNPATKFIDQYGEAVAAFLGGTYQEVPEQYAKATPATYLDKSDPPMLLLHGKEDKLVPYQQSVDFVAALEELGIEAKLYSEEGAGHSWFSFPPHFIPTTKALKAFLDRYFK